MEVYHNGQWGTICDENWGKEEAEVVCKELGYSGAMFAYKKAHSGQGTGPVCHIDILSCPGPLLQNEPSCKTFLVKTRLKHSQVQINSK